MTDYTKEPHNVIPLTSAAALAKAEALLADTSVGFSTPEARGIMAGLVEAIKSSPCFATAIREGRKTFVLIDKDPASPHAIFEWAHAAAKHGHRKEKVDEARRIAVMFQSAEHKQPS